MGYIALDFIMSKGAPNVKLMNTMPVEVEFDPCRPDSSSAKSRTSSGQPTFAGHTDVRFGCAKFG